MSHRPSTDDASRPDLDTRTTSTAGGARPAGRPVEAAMVDARGHRDRPADAPPARPASGQPSPAKS